MSEPSPRKSGEARFTKAKDLVENKIMANIDDVLKDVEDESTVEDSLIALTTNIKGQLDAALAGTTIPPAVQTKIDAIFTQVETNKAKAAAAIVANTQAA